MQAYWPYSAQVNAIDTMPGPHLRSIFVKSPDPKLKSSRRRSIMETHYRTPFARAKATLKAAGETPFARVGWRRDDDPDVYVLVRGLVGDDEEFTGGEYIVSIHMQPDHPFTPPHIRFLTPNGVVYTRLMQADVLMDGLPTLLGLYPIVLRLAYLLLRWRENAESQGYIGLIPGPDMTKIRALARYSRAHNELNHAEILALFTGPD